MKQMTKSLLCAGALVFSFSTLQAAPGGVHGPGGHGFGTDILHFQVVSIMTNNGVEPTAKGVVAANQNKQGAANNQRLDILMQGLTTNTPYSLYVGVVGDTNLEAVTNFVTDAKGNAALRYRSLGNGHGIGHGKNQLPSILDPISQIQELDVFNSSTQAVLTADLTMPSRFQYLVKRNLSSGAVSGLLQIIANNNQSRFNLTLSGLNASYDYYLAVNGDVVQTNSTDTNGNLTVTNLQTTLPILQVNSLAVLDITNNLVLNTTNVVISTTLP
jgi:hypothetical protein